MNLLHIKRFEQCIPKNYTEFNCIKPEGHNFVSLTNSINNFLILSKGTNKEIQDILHGELHCKICKITQISEKMNNERMSKHSENERNKESRKTTEEMD
jgi:hypothetical protein